MLGYTAGLNASLAQFVQLLTQFVQLGLRQVNIVIANMHCPPATIDFVLELRFMERRRAENTAMTPSDSRPEERREAASWSSTKARLYMG